MEVILEYYTPLDILVSAIRVCKGGKKEEETYLDKLTQRDKELIEHILQNKHFSVLEHVVYTYNIKNISRLCLQELVRHRIASYSVLSTRYTLKKYLQKETEPFTQNDVERASKYLVLQAETTQEQIEQLELLRAFLHNNKNNKISNNVLKYLVPESFKTELFFTINARSLRNFLELRTDKSAHFEIRQLAFMIYNELPEEHKFIYKDIITKNSEGD